MIRVYKFVEDEFLLACEIDEESGAVYGTSKFAEKVRNLFQDLEDNGYYPAQMMDKIRYWIENSYDNGYYFVE